MRQFICNSCVTYAYIYSSRSGRLSVCGFCVCAVAVLPSTYTSPTTKHLIVMLVFHPPNRRYAFNPHMPNYTKSEGTSPTNKIMARHLKHALWLFRMVFFSHCCVNAIWLWRWFYLKSCKLLNLQWSSFSILRIPTIDQMTGGLISKQKFFINVNRLTVDSNWFNISLTVGA